MKLKSYIYAFTLVLSLLNATTSVFATGRIEKNFNDDWKFAQVSAGQERPLPAQNLESTDALKVGSEIVSEPLGEAKIVRLPHDWAISGPFDTNPESWGWQGKLPWRGVGWYSKTFTLTETEASERVVLDFGGCMAFPEVYVNGKYAGGWDYGYMSFQVDISNFVCPGENRVQVRCDTRRHNSRWYPGAGIYRPVKMILCSRDAWLPEGSVFVTTPEITPEKATVTVQVKPEMKVDSISLNARIFDPTGNEITQKVALISDGESTFSVTVPSPKQWDVAEPNMYQLSVGGRAVRAGNTGNGCVPGRSGNRTCDGSGCGRACSGKTVAGNPEIHE